MMKERFYLALLLSLALHLLLMEVVSALDVLWSGARSGRERHIIPVSLLEIGQPAGLPAQPEGRQGRPGDKDASAPPPASKGGTMMHARNATAAPRRAFDKLPARPEDDPDSAKSIPQPAQSTVRNEPTERLCPEAEVRQSQPEIPAVAVATLPDDRQITQGSVPTPGAGFCPPADGPGGMAAGAGGAGAGTTEGSEVGGGGQGSAGGGKGTILIPGEFLANNSPPRYPLLARRNGWEGTVVIDILISESGRVQEARIEKTSGYNVLDNAALGAVRNWRIAPRDQADPPSLKFRVPVIFKLTPS
jgi:protein TonB